MDTIRNMSYDLQRQKLGEIYPLSTPFTVILDSSEACNFRCNYCFRSSNNVNAWGEYAIKKNIMSMDVFEKAVSQILRFSESVKQISLSCHGEPLCNRRLPQMARYIKDRGIDARISIHTNASLLNKEYAKEIAESGIDKIVVSLQGLDAEVYKRVCGVSIDYDDFFNNLAYLYKNKRKETKIHIKIMDIAVEGREEEFYERFGSIADTVFVEQMVPIWKNVNKDDCPHTIKNKYGQEFPLQECCPLIFNTIVVTPEGDVYPCTQITSKEKLGNIFDNTLVEMWNCEKRKELLIRQLTDNQPESCRDCYIRQNSIFSEEDMIDDYKEDILNRM